MTKINKEIENLIFRIEKNMKAVHQNTNIVPFHYMYESCRIGMSEHHTDFFIKELKSILDGTYEFDTKPYHPLDFFTKDQLIQEVVTTTKVLAVKSSKDYKHVVVQCPNDIIKERVQECSMSGSGEWWNSVVYLYKNKNILEDDKLKLCFKGNKPSVGEEIYISYFKEWIEDDI